MLRVYLLDKAMENKARESAALEDSIKERVEFKRARKYKMQVERMLQDLDKLNDKVIDDEMIKIFKAAVDVIELRQSSAEKR